MLEEVRYGPRRQTQEEVNESVKKLAEKLTRQIKEEMMGTFNINITAVGGHGCERRAKAGDKLFGRCGRFSCPDCMAYEFVQQLKQKGMFQHGEAKAELIHWPGTETQVVDDLLNNERKSGNF